MTVVQKEERFADANGTTRDLTNPLSSQVQPHQNHDSSLPYEFELSALQKKYSLKCLSFVPV